MAKLLEVKELTTQFSTRDGTVTAVDGISYDLTEGEIVGIVGESGCGKTVSALSIMRLLGNGSGKTVGGEVFFEGVDLLSLNNSGMRKIRGNRMAMIFQEPMTSLNPVLTIGRQLTETLELHMGMTKSSARQRGRELIDMVGIPDPDRHLGYYPHQLSGGMSQRVMIAIAISCNPKLILADEPTTSLDVTIQAQILELMKSLTEQLGTALVLITHNLGIVARYASRVMVMYAGKIVETGDAKDIYRDSRHPYTLGLLSSVPRLDAQEGVKLDTIEGTPPDLIDMPEGCRFANRCKYSIDQCWATTPELTAIEGTHKSACWRSDELPVISATLVQGETS